MECEHTGIPEPDIIWYKDGQTISSEHSPHVKVLRGGRLLQIVADTVDYTGMYVCQAQNAAGREQRIYRLTVQGNNSTPSSNSK